VSSIADDVAMLFDDVAVAMLFIFVDVELALAVTRNVVDAERLVPAAHLVSTALFGIWAKVAVAGLVWLTRMTLSKMIFRKIWRLEDHRASLSCNVPSPVFGMSRIVPP